MPCVLVHTLLWPSTASPLYILPLCRPFTLSPPNSQYPNAPCARRYSGGPSLVGGLSLMGPYAGHGDLRELGLQAPLLAGSDHEGNGAHGGGCRGMYDGGEGYGDGGGCDGGRGSDGNVPSPRREGRPAPRPARPTAARAMSGSRWLWFGGGSASKSNLRLSQMRAADDASYNERTFVEGDEDSASNFSEGFSDGQ